MAGGLRQISVVLSATVAPFKAQMIAAGASVNSFAGVVDGAAKKNNAAVKAMAAGMATVGAAAVGAAALSVKAAMQMETRMQNVATIWTDTGTSVAQAGNQIVEMSKTLPQSANNLAEGLYQVASSGFQGAEGMEVLRVSATAASAGLTTTAVAATGISAVLNAYGLKAGEAARVSDVLFTTVNLGVVSFEELSQTLGDFVGLASQAHISIEDVMAAYATMTLNGISAAEAGTSVNRVIQSIIQPSEQMAATLAKAGYASGQAALDALGLKGVVELLSKATGGSATAMGLLVPEIRGLRGILALTSAEGETYGRVAGQMTDVSQVFGAAQAALAEQSKSTSFQLGILKNTVVAVAIDFGQALLPILKPVIDGFQALATAFGGLPGPIQTIVVGGGLLTAIVVGLAGSYLLLAPRIAATITLMQGSTAAAAMASRAFTVLKASMGLIGLALAVAVPLMMAFGKSKGDARQASEDLKSALDQETGAIVAGTAAAIAKKAVDEGLDKDARKYGVSLETLTGAMMGEANATALLNARLTELKKTMPAADAVGRTGTVNVTAHAKAVDEFGKKVTGSATALETAGDSIRRKTAAEAAASGTTRTLSGDIEGQAIAAQADADALRDLGSALAGISSISAAVSAATAAASGGGAGGDNSAVKAKINERHQLEQDALDATQKAETAALDARNQLLTDALDLRHRTELDALDKTQRAVVEAFDLRVRTELEALDASQKATLAALEVTQRAVMDAMDERHRAEDEAYDREARTRKQALDARQDAEQDALDDRLALLDDEYDAKKKAEERLYDLEVDRIQAMIDDTFGEEREGWKAQLIGLEDAHDDRLNTLDHAQTAEVRALENGLDDKQQAERNGLDDQLLVYKNGITDRQAAQKQALTDEQAAEKQAVTDRLALVKQGITDRQTAEKQAVTDQLAADKQAFTDRQAAESTTLAARLTSLTAALDLQQGVVDRALTTRQTREDAAADTRRSSASAKAELTLADVQAQFTKLQEEADASFLALETIYKRGGGKVSTAMLAEIQKLPPKVQTELANAGAPAFDKFIDTLETSMRTRDLSSIANQAKRIGGAINLGITTGFAVAGGVAVNPLVATPTMVLADGAVSRQALISSRPILWAEAGPEAYIPLRRHNTQRSLALTAQVAGYYGHGLIPMADGGIRGGVSGGAGGGISVMVSVENHLAPGIDMGVAGRIIGERVEAGVREALDTVGRQVTSKAWRN